ncbi:hypothetical protein JDFnp1_139 [Fusobacterium phage JD-Fnp1]|nr:hypothetical protein JDFnp1_139 [Fusobacterium phage JD-Fnp1]
MEEVKDVLEAYDELRKPKEVMIDMTDFLKEQYEKQIKDISEFYSCDMISPYKVKRNVTGKQYEFEAFLKGEEVTLILSDSEYNFDELASAKSLEYFTMCITGAWTILRLEKDGKLTPETFGTSIMLMNDAFNMMSLSHQKLNKDFNRAFKDKVEEIDKKLNLNREN